jgi:hypothetical protein
MITRHQDTSERQELSRKPGKPAGGHTWMNTLSGTLEVATTVNASSQQIRKQDTSLPLPLRRQGRYGQRTWLFSHLDKEATGIF